MNKLFLCALLVTTLTTAACVIESPDEIALTLVEKYKLGQNLTPLSYQVATNSQTYRMIVNKVGEQNAKTRVNAEIDKLIPEYQDKWNKNLASSYAQVFSPEELKSIIKEGSSSKYAPEFQAKQNEVGKLMQSQSEELLIDLMTKAMLAAHNQMVH